MEPFDSLKTQFLMVYMHRSCVGLAEVNTLLPPPGLLGEFLYSTPLTFAQYFFKPK